MTEERAERPDPAGAQGRFPPILMYHSVAHTADDPYNITVTPERLDRQLAWLRRRGLRGVSVAELLDAHTAGRSRGMVGLTFDDGYADFAEHALPVLRRHRCTATLYVVAGRIGEVNAWDEQGDRRRLLDADGVRAMARAGVEIGAHGMLHRHMAGLPEAELKDETAGCRALLEEVLGRAPAGFCYPYGEADAAAAAAVEDAGFAYACGIRRTGLTGRWALPRRYVGSMDVWWRLEAKLLKQRLTERGGVPL
ncbi:hypothetical protein BIV57_18625 [Mangrovactinospora gilvigrisea]|uniref:NodB homology domain-containing protein n=1 Tax=Mangrovactinospora gilvigrisea TaxID=1428644 RepID=A0A1J7C359_9ACTN|nr:polysaccharide deacetylase family protein [Mangrovactinospora gilvigrisea]OIV35992.1 hypothetical protein BIV57_18625 [Mangrovactinospora gilvigrisea]